MSKKISFALALAALCGLSLFLVNCGSTSSRPTGVLYVLTEAVNNNGGLINGNNVSSYAIDINTGALTLINYNASTCTSASANCGLPLSIAFNPAGSAAFVLNQGLPSASVPPTIYTYTVNSDHSLSTPTVATTPTLVAGDLALAMALDAGGNFLFVITQGNQSLGLAPQLLVFSVSATTLTPVANASPVLTRIPSALSSVTYTPPGGSAEEFLYVTYNQDLVLNNDNTLSAYSVSSTGVLTDLTPNEPYVTPTNPISVLAVNTNPAGENTGGVFVFVGNQGTSTGAISVYEVCTVVNASCKTTQNLGQLIPPTGPPVSAGDNPVAMLADPTNSFLYATSALTNQVFGYRINLTTGALVPLSTPYQPTGTLPVAMAIQPSVDQGDGAFSGEFLFVANNNSSSISGYSINTSTGAMGNQTTVISNPGPSGMSLR
ncbi:MAG: hypothetical protein WAM89_07565 [Terriglobales bacterium]